MFNVIQGISQGAGAFKNYMQSTQSHHTELVTPVVSEQTTLLPPPVSASLRQSHGCKPHASSIVMNVTLLGFFVSIGLHCLGMAKNNEQGDSADTPNNLLRSSFLFMAIFICAAGISAEGVANREDSEA